MFNVFHRVTGKVAGRSSDGPSGSAIAQIAAARTPEALVAALVERARAVVGSDGITVVRRDGDAVVYVGEDAISPLWTGQRFPIRMCVSGQAMLARAPIVIPDIEHDRRVPLNAYLSTFVRSMVLVPIGHDEPGWAMGAYWCDAEPIASIAVERMTELAAAAADALLHMEGRGADVPQVA